MHFVKVIKLKRCLANSIAFLFFLFLSNLCNSQVMGGPYRWHYCTFAQNNSTTCIQYECKAVIDGSDVNHRITFKNAPNGESSKASPSWYLYVERKDGQRVFIRMDENNFIESTDGTE